MRTGSDLGAPPSQPTRGGFSTIGTIVTIHRCGMLNRSSWTDRTMPKIFDPFKLSSAVRPQYWARRQRRASTELVVSTVCTMTSSGQAAHSVSQTLTNTLAFHSSRLSFRRPQCASLCAGLNVRSTVRFNALMTPMRANIVGPPDVATRIKASIAACHSWASCSEAS